MTLVCNRRFLASERVAEFSYHVTLMNACVRHSSWSSCRWLLPAILACASSGCARQVSLSSWQKSVEQYVRDQGSGDPASLRDVTLPDSRRGFASIGDPNPEDSSDVYGVLLGHREMVGRHWFIYLVGHVRDLAVVDIRIAAVSFNGDRPSWRIGAVDAEQVAVYCAFHQDEFTRRFEPLPPPQLRSSFPQPDDVFEMLVDSPAIVVTHQQSGATWRLDMPSRQ